MKITHGVMVILQGVWCQNLYYLKGSTSDEVNTSVALNDATEL